jgi:cell division septal protein FtsQ
MKRLQNLFKRIWKYLLIVVIAVTVWVVYSSTTIFNFSNIQISSVGSDKLVNVSNEEISKNINYLSTTKYLDLDLIKLEEDIKKSSPFIDSVFIFKDLPSKVSILIYEKTPIISLEIEKKKCVLMDSYGFVLKIEEQECTDQVKEYKTILVSSDTPKVEFNVGSISNYNQLFLITKTLKILSDLEIPVTRIDIKDNISKFVSTNQKQYVISFNQEIEPQLARLIAVVNELEKKSYKFKSIDIRFNRPVLTIK